MKQYRVGTYQYRFGCDASEKSFQLCLPYRRDGASIKEYDKRSYGVWNKENRCWIIVFKVERIE